ncbi:hypothetical protein K0M31_001063 [Melipona bicolor]|uniref:Flap endonuclease GEN chromatin organization modifier domain-containing protein n=1 Tax=Melipona bicolor TaxID=60889 RepID=A0AA40GET0_9HYME|nr:hypothetical protein K0M31_001063 [Melipona bicolor]
MEQHLSWEPQYAFEKIFPLVTRWQIVHLPDISAETRLTIPDLYIPEAIKKIRNIRSVASYEIIWKTDHNTIERLKEYIALNNDGDNDADILSELISIEPQNAVRRCYPELVEIFENARNAKTKKRPTKKKLQNGTDDSDGKRKAEKRRQKRNEKVEGNKKIDEFISKTDPVSLEESFRRMSITPKRSKKSKNVDDLRENAKRNDKIKRGPQFDKVLQIENINSKLNNTLDRMFNELSPDDFVSDNDDINMSEIIDDICNQKIFQFNESKDMLTINHDNNPYEMRNTENVKTIDNVVNLEIKSNQCLKNDTIHDQSFDEFADITESYIPLSERIKKKRFQRTSTLINNRYTFGIDALMNDTDLENQHT